MRKFDLINLAGVALTVVGGIFDALGFYNIFLVFGIAACVCLVTGTSLFAYHSTKL